MIDALKRLARIGQQEPAKADNQTEGVAVTTEAKNEGTGLAVEMADQVTALTATVTSLTEQVAANAAALAEKDATIAALTAQVEAAVEFKAAQEKAAAEAKIAARNSKLVEVVGTDAAAGLMAATASLDDTAFDAVVNAMSVKAKVEATAPAFKEVGVEGTADASKVSAEAGSGNRVMDYLKNVTHEKSDLITN